MAKIHAVVSGMDAIRDMAIVVSVNVEGSGRVID
jgi:hypothetical protein